MTYAAPMINLELSNHAFDCMLKVVFHEIKIYNDKHKEDEPR